MLPEPASFCLAAILAQSLKTSPVPVTFAMTTSMRRRMLIRAFRAFFVEKVKAGTSPTLKAERIPVFGYQEVPVGKLVQRVGVNIVVLLALAALLWRQLVGLKSYWSAYALSADY